MYIQYKWYYLDIIGQSNNIDNRIIAKHLTLDRTINNAD